jgi:hypothetical protein
VTDGLCNQKGYFRRPFSSHFLDRKKNKIGKRKKRGEGKKRKPYRGLRGQEERESRGEVGPLA